MVEWHTKSDRMANGAKRKTLRRCTKKKAWKGGTAAHTKAEVEAKEQRNVNKGLGNTKKVRVTSTKYVNIFDNGKVTKAEIIDVEENNANRLFARSNIVTKGAVIKVKLGSTEKTAKVTNRPGQEGIINAILA
jgi:small subunit ribosomal protein S8e